jgi:hypothetical protein
MRTKRKYPPVESVADFRARIAALVRGSSNTELPPVRRSHPCVVRRPTDRGYYPPTKKGK